MKKQLLSSTQALLLTLTILVSSYSVSNAQQVTAEDYRQAKQFLSQNTYDKVLNQVSGANWENGKLIYSKRTGDGTVYMIADPERGEKRQAFDHDKLAESLSEFTDRELKGRQLPLRSVELSGDGETLQFQMMGDRYETT